MNERFEQIQNRLKELANPEKIENAKIDELEAIEEEVKQLTEERSKIEQEKRQSLVKRFEKGDKNVEQINERNTAREEIEERARNLQQHRAISLGSLDLIAPEHIDGNVRSAFNEVSSIVDLVELVHLENGDSYKVAYEKTVGDATVIAEGGQYKGTEPTFGYAPITKSKIGTIVYETEELQKLGLADYDTKIRNSISQAVRKRLTAEILFGNGTTDHLVGIFSDKAGALDGSSDLAIAKIDENTLDEIICSYGSKVDITEATLIMSKETLKEFVKVRGADKRKVYEIDYSRHTIDNVPFVLVDGLKSSATATTGEYLMAYGSLKNYTLTSFDNYELKMSEDAKFDEGLIAYRGRGFFGGNVSKFNGFVRVKKSANK